MATIPETDPAADNGKPTRTSPPVIRLLAVAEEDGKTRLLHRQGPAFAISGLIHVLLFTVFFLIWKYYDDNKDVTAKERGDPTSANLDNPPPPDPDLTNPDLGLDSDLAASVPDAKESDLNVVAPTVENEAAGLPDHDREFATQTANLGQMTNIADLAGIASTGTEGTNAVGLGGAGGSLALPGLRGRSGATKENLLRSGGGNDETEAAVARALVWLAKQQKGDGYWEFDGSHRTDRVAATGMCLLPFLAAGETHLSAKRYKTNVAKGLDYLKMQLQPTGQFKAANAGNYMYSQAIATIAICEAAGMTQDDKLKKLAKLAVNFIVSAQAGNGSWGYSSGIEGDTSIVGWQIQALKSAKLAGIAVPDKAMKQAEAFLVGVSEDSESQYGYRSKGASYSLSSVGLLSRIYIMDNARHALVARGVKNLWTNNKPTESNWDMYYYYYATQVVHFYGRKEWYQDWNPLMRSILLKKQITDKTVNAKQTDIGSWPKEAHFIGSSCGKLGTTALACLTLEVYYRHLPLYKRDSAGLQELENKQ